MARTEARTISDCRLLSRVLHAESDPPLCQPLATLISALLNSYVCVSIATDYSHGESVLFHGEAVRNREGLADPCIRSADVFGKHSWPCQPPQSLIKSRHTQRGFLIQ